MVDLDTQMKIDTLANYAYDHTIERLTIIETAPFDTVHRTKITEKNHRSILMAYLNYYTGCFEGILFTRFLEEFNRMPMPSENVFIHDTLDSKFEKLKEIVLKAADKRFNEFEEKGWPEISSVKK